MNDYFVIYDAEADAVVRILVEEIGLRDDRVPGVEHDSGCARDVYDWLISGATSREIRLHAGLGYGGKLLIQATQQAPVVTCYAEDETEDRLEMMRRANERLGALFADIDLFERAEFR